MTDEYIDAFLQEGEEQITQLNNSLLELEADPDNEAAMDEIFRTAHTLKGNFAAMGFEDASDLAHAIEDLLDAIRQGSIEVNPKRMDLIFAGVDQIETALAQIDTEGEPNIDPTETITQLRRAIEAEEHETVPESDSLDPTIDIDDIDADLDNQAHELIVEIDPGELKGVDAMLVLEELESNTRVLATDPSQDQLESGEFDQTFNVLVDIADPETVKSTLDEVSPVESVQVIDRSDHEPTAESTQDGPSMAVDEIESVRVDVDRLDHLYRLVEQFVTGHVRLERAVETGDLDSVAENVEELGKTTETLQDTVIDMRLVPFETIVGKFPRLVRDLAREQDKQVDFTITGREVEIDRSILSELGDPLTHLLRNAVDHGIESPKKREQAGKDPEGSVELRARRERDHVLIEIEDDGSGLDVEGIKQTALEQGLRTREEIERMSDSDLYDLIFHPGFSTTDEVTDVSGRGVGMDVVNQTISQLDGSINVESDPGSGTTVTLELPVTMAIVQVLILQVGEEEYGIPIKHVGEITTREEFSTLDGEPVLEYDEDIYRVIELAEEFDVPNADSGDKVIRVDPDERQVALTCSQVRSQQTVVVKPLEGILSGTPGLSGTAILGDGEIMYLLDINTL